VNILVDIDGVLRTKDDDPISTGILMVGTLTVYNRIRFMTSMSEEETIRWCNVNKVVDFDQIIDSSVHLEGEVLAKRQITVARSTGSIDLFITGDPTLWAYAFDLGIPSVMFGVPSYLRAEFRPDAPKKVRAWNEIEEAVNKQNVLRTTDARLLRNENVKFE
jgi:hypothetical protein